MSNTVPTAAQRALHTCSLRLWTRMQDHLGAAALEGRPGPELLALAGRLDALERFLPAAAQRQSAGARTLITLGHRLERAAEPLRMQLLVCCYSLVQQRSEAMGEALSVLQHRAREELRAATDDACDLRATRFLIAFHHTGHEAGPVALAESTLGACAARLQEDTSDLLQRWLVAVAQQVREQLLTADWKPASIAHHGLMRAWRRLHALALLSGRADLLRQVIHHETVMQTGHLLRHAAADAALVDCHSLLWSLQDESEPAALPCSQPSTPPTPMLQQAMHNLHARLCSTGDATGLDLGQVALGYELASAATQHGHAPTAIFLRCLHAVLAEHWHQGAACPPAISQVLGRVLESEPSSVQDVTWLRDALYRMAELWPGARDRASVTIPLADGGGCMTAAVRLDAVPSLLSRGLPHLNAAREDWFDDQAAFAPHQLAVQGELMLLERGAAAVKVRPVEQLCGHLLELLMNLDLPGAVAHFPGRLLWRAHQHLLQLLDAAAAWWEAVPDRMLLAALREDARRTLPSASSSMVAEPATTDEEPQWSDIRQRLTGYVQTFSGVLDVQVRLDASGDGDSWPGAQLQQLHAALIPLLRFLLLEFSLTLEDRRARHLPLTGCLWLVLGHDESGHLMAQLRDDAVCEPPGAVQWQQLRHRLRRHGIIDMTCTTTPLGRCFTLHPGTAPDQQPAG